MKERMCVSLNNTTKNDMSHILLQQKDCKPCVCPVLVVIFFAAFTLLQKRKNKAQVTSFVESYVLYYTGTTF